MCNRGLMFSFPLDARNFMVYVKHSMSFRVKAEFMHEAFELSILVPDYNLIPFPSFSILETKGVNLVRMELRERRVKIVLYFYIR